MTVVAVLGCGPAGLLAAHAVESAGHDVQIISKRSKSIIGGAQYVHDPIPLLTAAEPDGVLTYVKRGTKQGYAAKVYGSPNAPCSWDRFPTGNVPAWSMSAMYDRLWDKYATSVTDEEVHGEDIPELLGSFPLVLSSIPLPALCEDPTHLFPSQPIWITRTAAPSLWPNTILYNGEQDGRWYRSSWIFGERFTEWAASPTVEDDVPESALEGFKPLNTNCDCFPRIERLGRFGTWRKGVLVHHAYQAAVAAVERRLNAR